MKKVILDTNFLLIPVQFNVDIFSEIQRIFEGSYQVCVLDKTVAELKEIIDKQKGKSREAAKIALQLLKAKKVKALRTKADKDVDALLVELSKNSDVVVATQDAALRKKLKSSKIILRQKKYLMLKG